jgi:DNA-directed RNA polymerase subunit RPC12/RpoP
MRIEGTVYERIYKDHNCPHCSHRRKQKEKVTVLWIMPTTERNPDVSSIVIMCDRCAVRLARGILQDAEAGLVRDASSV